MKKLEAEKKITKYKSHPLIHPASSTDWMVVIFAWFERGNGLITFANEVITTVWNYGRPSGSTKYESTMIHLASSPIL